MSTNVGQSLSIRITSHGKIKTWVTLALNQFENNPNVPVVLHTLPAKDAEHTKTGQDTKKLPNSIATIPRLVSVVEIIKREFLKGLAEKRSARLKGLHQYNEVGILEDISPRGEHAVAVDGQSVSPEEAEENRARAIVDMLSGKNNIKQVQTPYMRVTLSFSEIPDLVSKGATYQPPKSRTLAKSAKARAKKRAKNEKASVPAEIAPLG
ncbi:hypothetical protein FA15DRAFT_686441 [Coprinopsis marcescibilis]|uniref:Uncharacterized protein n=1 Tax=Coprinopsis marcescibilis TaxID=230819 RepID=A0A5C3L1F0_COPMA|nr:hypothetical protein FA15DRAFT_686441 [Coprinopsis marcescibilis]